MAALGRSAINPFYILAFSAPRHVAHDAVEGQGFLRYGEELGGRLRSALADFPLRVFVRCLRRRSGVGSLRRQAVALGTQHQEALFLL